MLSAMDAGAAGAQTLEDGPVNTIESIKERIWEDPLSADLQWSLFVSAARSYRHNTVLRPFPPMFRSGDEEKDIKSLLELMVKVPRLLDLPRECGKLPQKLLDLIQWVLEARSFSISLHEKAKFEEIRQKTGHTVNVPVPNYIFEVTPSASANEKFEQLRDGRQLLYAYHGSRLENFHSILHNGLVSNMNKTSVFGEGTYLSGELSVSLIYSPTGHGWDHSSLGNKLSCIAVCEMIDDPSVKCQDRPSGSDGRVSKTSTSVRSRANAGPSEGGHVPEKYYVVQNDKVVRVKYVLVYSHKTNTHRSKTVIKPSWFQQHKFIVMMLIYFGILCVIGVMNSNLWRRYWGRR